MTGIATLFAPTHVVIVGASSDPERIGGRPIAFLRKLGFEGVISPVNPRYDSIQGLPCYASVADVPGDPDLVLIAVKQSDVVAVLEECGIRGISAAIIFTAGFGETGAEGEVVEREIHRVALRHGIRVLGPNSVGLISAPGKAPLTFATCLDSTTDLGDGSIGIISQSGAIGAFLHRELQLRNHPARHFVAAGNEVDVNAGEYLEFMVEDPGTRAVGLYLEGVRNGASFIAGLKRARELRKPVVVLKVGASELAKAAAVSHTGALAGDDEVIDAMLRQYGAIRVNDLDDLLACLELATTLPSIPEGGGMSSISISGGIGVWTADLAGQAGLALPVLSESSQVALTALLPGFANVRNPVDVTGQVVNSPGLLAQSIEVVGNDPAIDLVMVALGIQDARAEELSDGIISAFHSGSGRLAVSWMAGPPAAIQRLRDEGIMVFTRIGEGLRAMINLALWAEYSSDFGAFAGLDLETGEIGDVSTEFAAKQLLHRIGIASPASVVVTGEAAASEAFDHLGMTHVVVKGQVPGVAHKSDLGFVELSITSREGAAAAYSRIRDRAVSSGSLINADTLSCIVERQVVDAVELLLGARRDPVFGTLVVLGHGGTQTELVRSFATRIAPLSESDIDSLLAESGVLRVLNGFRGDRPVADLEPLKRGIRRFAQFAAEHGDRLPEIEINPLAVVRETGAILALDALITDSRAVRTEGVAS